MDSEEFQARLKTLTENFLRSLPERVQLIESLWPKVQSGQYTMDEMNTLHRTTHSLAGSGATFGFPEISDTARAAERILKILSREERGPGGEERHLISLHLGKLRQVVSTAMEKVLGESLP